MKALLGSYANLEVQTQKLPQFNKNQSSYLLYSFFVSGLGFFLFFVDWGRMTKLLIFSDTKSETIIPNRKTEFSTHLLTVLKSKVIKSKNISEQQKLKVLPLGKQ